jgi:hypothetical protein
VETIDQGISLLTGVPAGELDEEGNFPEGSVNYLVQERLLEMAEEKQDEEENPSSSEDGQSEGDSEG